ncbi:hypothetical protein N9Q05_01920 [bacterium]|nr:hypothetical protein [bacterium]
MPKYVVFNTVNYDGVGDFSHFKEIMLALLANPMFKDVEFTAIVAINCSRTRARYDSIHDELKSLGIQFYYGDIDEHIEILSKDKDLQKELQQADQAIIISFDDISSLYEPYFKKNIPIKLIGEHECVIAGVAFRDFPLNQNHSLGLKKGFEGIKIKNNPHLSPQEAWNIIETHHPEFSAQLLNHTGSNDFESFYEKNMLVPAYSNTPHDFERLVNVFIKNQSLSGEKNIIFFQSGFKYSDYLDSPDFRHGLTEKWLVGSKIAKIDLLMPANAPLQFAGNQAESKTISIFAGFYLLDPAYDAIYQLAKVAGVSGDNSLERAISMGILPIYWSTNAVNKIGTIHALREITQSLDIPQEAKEAFNIFFRYSPFEAPVAHINFQDMIKAWPTVTHYLRTHKNFYNKLEDIVLKDLPIKPSLDTRNITTDVKQKLQASKEDDNLSKTDKPSGGCSTM